MNCIVCKNEFKKLGNSKTCSKECSEINKEKWNEKHKIEGKWVYCIICRKEFRKLGKAKTCSKECSDTYRKKTNNEYQKEYQKTPKGIESQKKYKQTHKYEIRKYEKEYQTEYQKKYRKTPKGKDITKNAIKKYRKTPKGKESNKKSSNKRHRSFDFIPLNDYFPSSHAHHIDEKYVIYIPEELHRSIWHSVLNNINMNEINLLAWSFLESNSY